MPALRAGFEVAHGGLADRLRTAVGDRALDDPARDGHEVEQLAGDAPEAEARADDPDQLTRALWSMSCP